MFRGGGYDWWVSRDCTNMMCWGGASPGSCKYACGMTNSCAKSSYGCNCDAICGVWREDSGLTDKTHFQLNSSGLGIQAETMRKVTIRWGN